MLAQQQPPEVFPSRPLVCDACGGTLRLVEITDNCGRVLHRAPLPPYLDSS